MSILSNSMWLHPLGCITQHRFAHFCGKCSILTVLCRLATAPLFAATISAVNVVGTNVVFTGVGATAGATYYVMSTTNLMLSPIGLWSRSGSNVIAADGRFTNGLPLDPTRSKCFAVVATLPLKNSSLVAAYSFDESAGATLADVSGNGHTGTIADGGWTTDGRFGSALVFNGVSSLVTIPDAASLRLTNGLTLEAWVRPSLINDSWRDVIYKGDDNYFLEADSTSASEPAAGGTFGGADVQAFGPTPLPMNSWTHLTETYDRTNLILYLNGTLAASRAQTGSILTSTNPLQLGGDSIYGQYFQGDIDEVRIYNVALTPAQVMTDANTPVGDLPSAPILTATPVGQTSVSLAWTAASARLGVGGYVIERTGPGDLNFGVISSCMGTNFSDLGVLANTNYSYRVRAVDTIGDLGPYSNQADVSTGLQVVPRAVALTPIVTQQFTTSPSNVAVTWWVDGVQGGSVSSGTISSNGLYTPPAIPGQHTVTAVTLDLSQSPSATVYISVYAGMFTSHNDNLRTGMNTNETVLTPSNVTAATFGKLLTRPTDGLSFSSPLYVAGVNVPSNGLRNLVFVATEHDSVYAFDAEGSSTNPVWHVSFINPGAGVTTVPAAETGETGDIPNEIGITGTPVIDPNASTLYVVAKTKEVSGNTTTYVQRLHALALATGAEKFGGPVVLSASVNGSGDGAQGGEVAFVPLRENQRPALLLNAGSVYFAFASHGDQHPWHGWVLGYNATNLTQTVAYNNTPNGYGAGIWQSGDGLVADESSNIFFVSGNGTFDANSGGSDYGDSFEKISATGAVVDYFTPYDQSYMDVNNIDLGAGGVLGLPNQPGAHPHLLLSAGKNGTIYLIDRDNMGHFNATNDNQIVQVLRDIFTNGVAEPGNFCSPVYFNNRVYFSPIEDNLKAFSVSNGLLSASAVSQTSEQFTYPGGTMAISSSGSTNGILWVVQRHGYNPDTGEPATSGVLHAYNPSDLTHEYYNSDQAGTRDTMDYAAKFNIPLIANGKVFVVSENRLTVYGLLP
jgi:hypothetical protein